MAVCWDRVTDVPRDRLFVQSALPDAQRSSVAGVARMDEDYEG